MSNTITRLATAAGLACSVAVALPAAGQTHTHSADSGNSTTGNHMPPTDWGDLPITDDSIQTSRLLHANREAIALTAEWRGPGPHDLAPILDGSNSDWVGELEAEVRAMGLTAHHHGLTNLVAGMNGNGWADVAAWFAPAAGVDVDDQNTYGSRGHLVLNLWPVVQTNDGMKGQIPYTFSADMIAAYTNRFVTDDPEEINSANGVANALAVMLILEQELPIQFVGFNPVQHDTAGSLIFDSVGTGDPVPGANNTVNRLGRAPAADDGTGNALPPTQITHNSWQNFPSMIRSMGFVLGMDWEQRHPNRDIYIEIHPENMPPQGFPVDVAPADGIDGPGIPNTPFSNGPLFYEQSLQPTNVPEADGCDFDLDSMMLLGPFDYTTIGPTHTIRDPYRYEDYDGNGSVNTTPGGPDDRMFSQPLPVFFSECDLASLTATYSNAVPWYYGQDESCPYDINGDNVQDGFDADLFLDLFAQSDSSADLVPPFGQVDQDDLDVFNGDLIFPGIEPFTVQDCTGANDDELPDDFRWFYGKNPLCPHDVDENEVQNGEDGNAFQILHAAGDPSADLVPPFGTIDDDDFDAFFEGQAPYTIPFFVGDCVEDPDVVGWYYGKNVNCPHDVDENLVQDARDIVAFRDLWDNMDFAADLVPPFGQIDLADFQAFIQGDAASGIEQFTPGFCNDDGPPGPANRPGRTDPG